MAHDTLENRVRIRLQQILLLERRLRALIERLQANEFGLAAVDPAGALDGDGSAVDPLAVRVDGTTIQINDDNQLVALPDLGGTFQNTFLVSGGQVVWVDDYDFLVSAATYYIDGVLFSSPQTPVTLTAADPTDDRIDVIAVDDNGDVIVIEGTAAAQPAEPDVDPSTQLKLAIVLVSGGTTQPESASTAIVYEENAGNPFEWDFTSSGSGWNLASTNNPRSGTIDIEATTIASGAYIEAEVSTPTFFTHVYSHLVLHIRSKANWTNNRTLQVRLQNAGVVYGATITVGQGTFGFDSTQVSGYQQIGIPIPLFAVPQGQSITQIRITRAGNSTIGFYLDDVWFAVSGTQVPAGGLTLEQANALYAPLIPSYVTLAVNATLPNERVLTAGTGIAIVDSGAGGAVTISATGESSPGSPENALDGTEYPIKFTVKDTMDITTGVKDYTALIPPVGYDGTIIAWNLFSRQTGDIEINVRKNGASITSGNNPELATSDEEDDTDLSDWSDQAVVGGDRIDINVLSCTGIEFFELQLVVVRT